MAVLFKLFTKLGIKGRVWLVLKDLYTDINARVLFSDELSREFDVSQGTGQGRVFVPFMYEVYIDSLLATQSEHCLQSQLTHYPYLFLLNHANFACACLHVWISHSHKIYTSVEGNPTALFQVLCIQFKVHHKLM